MSPMLQVNNESLCRREGRFCIRAGKLVEPDFIRQALAIDRVVYPGEFFLSFEQCLGFFRKNPYVYLFALDEATGRVVGYVNYSPLGDAAYESIRKGTCDSFLTAADVVAYSPGEEHSLYFSSIVVHPDFRRMGVSRLLQRVLDVLVAELRRCGIFIVRELADVLSDGGERIVTSRGYRFVGMSGHGTKIMEKTCLTMA